MSKTISLHHIVFGTKHRLSTINDTHREDLYRFIWHLLKERNCFLCRINGMPDHIHLLIDLNPNQALSVLMKELKTYTSQWMKKSGYFPVFEGWGKGYYAASVSFNDKDSVVKYIIDQQAHHQSASYENEMKGLYKRNCLQWHDEDMG